MKSMSNWAVRDFLASGRASDSVLMLTLTSAKVISGGACRDSLNKFMTALKKHYHQKFRYFVVRELQLRGAFHYHIVFLDLLWIPYKLVCKFWPIGWVWLSVKRGSVAVRYIIKYVCKDLDKEGVLHSSYYALESVRLPWRKFKEWFSFNFHFSAFLTNCMFDKINVVKYYDRLLIHFQKIWDSFGPLKKGLAVIFTPKLLRGVA